MIEELSGKRVGVWGYGVSGKAIADFLLAHDIIPTIFDEKPLSSADAAFLQDHRIPIASTLAYFLEDACDVIIPSPGVDLRPHTAFAHKWLAEFDLFANNVHTPIIAITGSLGKTTVTHTIGRELEHAGKRVLVGGNIGVGLCSLIDRQHEADYVVLECSSFQLEACKTFAPHIAVWTNFYPNHIDRHGSLDAYFDAKARIVQFQKSSAVSIVPEHLHERIAQHAQTPHRWITVDKVGYIQNHANVQAVMDALGLDVTVEPDSVGGQLEHRLEFVRSVNGIDFYNDSKSTVPQATLAALDRLSGRPIILILGGLSKGVSRESLIQALAGRVKNVICIGKEAQQLTDWCTQYEIANQGAPSFADAVKLAYTKGVVGDVVLLSPSGSSFDLFKNYQERGAVFKQLVGSL